MTEVFVGMGSNLGDRAVHLRTALAELDRTPGFRVRAVSRFRVTAPVGGPPQPDYVNAVAQIESVRTPQQTLAELLATERRHGRRRTVADGPRTLDLDLLLFGGAVLEQPSLVLPHPRMRTRRFVLEPLAELAEQLPLPGGGTVCTCLRALTA